MTSHGGAPNLTLCVGIDPQATVLEAWGLPDTEAGLSSFVGAIVPLLEDSGTEVAKPQVAFFERHGVAGMRQLAVLVGELRMRGIRVIGDAKRGDIGSTLVGYAEAWLSPGADFEVDYLTLAPYQGLGALEPALTLATEHGKTVFVLAATSNPEAWPTQRALRADGLSVAHGVVRDLSQWGYSRGLSPSAHGVVLGATIAPDDFGITMSDYPGMPVLSPGFGHQGASLSHARNLFPSATPVFAVVARSVLLAGEDGFVSAIQSAQRELAS